MAPTPSTRIAISMISLLKDMNVQEHDHLAAPLWYFSLCGQQTVLKINHPKRTERHVRKNFDYSQEKKFTQ